MRLTEPEVNALWESYVVDRDPVVLDQLVRHYDGLARFLARRAIARAPSHQDPEELISSAQRGLLEAASRFEPGRGLKFETFASRRITGAIIDDQRKNDPLTRSDRTRVSALRDAQSGLWDRLQRPGTNAELALETGETEEAVRQLLVQQQTLTTELDEGAARAVHDQDRVHLEELETRSREELASRLAGLSQRDRVFILLYYVEERTLREVGALIGCSDSRCAQIRKEIMAALI